MLPPHGGWVTEATSYLATVLLECRLSVRPQTLPVSLPESAAARHAGIEHACAPLRPLPVDLEEVDPEVPQLGLDDVWTLDATAQGRTTQYRAVALCLRRLVTALHGGERAVMR